MRNAAILSALAFVSAAFIYAAPSSAQVQTYVYYGPGFDPAQCAASGYGSACTGGSVTASVTLSVPANYSGTVYNDAVVSYTANANGIGSLSQLNYLDSNFYTLSQGEMNAWQLQAGDICCNTPSKYILTKNTSPDDRAYIYNGGVTAIGMVNQNGYWLNPKSLGIACARPGAASCGEPIDIGSGNMFTDVPDYTTVGQNPLAFTRYYNSMANPDTYATSMGQNWRHNYDRYLHILNPSAIYGVMVERPDGQVITFSSNSGTYTPDSDVDLTLANPSGSTWTLTDGDNTVETYTASGGKGTLNSIRLRNGYTQAITYSSSQISYVSDSYSRQLGFSYSSAGLLTGITTPDALNFTYGYVTYSSTGQSALTSVSYNTSPVQSQSYLYENASYPFALTGIIDENGVRYSSWGYDDSGRATSSQLAGGVNFTSVSYDDATGNRAVTGPLGIQETYKFTTLQGVPKVTQIDRAANGSIGAASRLFTYDSAGYLASQTDWNGNQTAFTNNSYGLPTAIVYASGTAISHTASIAYSSTWPRLPLTIATPGVTASLTYDSSGNMLTRTLTDTTAQTVPYATNGQTRTWTYTYNSTGQLLSVQLPRTDVTAKTSYGYAGGVLNKITDALGYVTTISTYKDGGLPKNVGDPNGVQTAFAWNSRLRLSSITVYTSSGNFVTGFTYDSAGNLTRGTPPDNAYLNYAYDNAHRLTKITNRLSETQNFTLDAAGNVTQDLWKNASNVTARQRTATFDALGRMLTDVGGMSQTTAITYDSNSNVLTVTDPLSRTTTQTWDALNRPVGFTDAAVNFTSVSYDAHDRPLAIRDPKGNTTSYIYNGFGDLIQQTSPDSGTTVWTYDENGNVLSRTDATGAITNYTWDALDRPLTRAYPADSSLNVTYTWDQAGHGYGIGQLTTLRDQAGCSSRDYDARGLMTRDVRIVGGTGAGCTGGNSFTTGLSYESAGRLNGITYGSGGWLVSYTRDNAAQVTTVTTTQPGMSPVNLATSVTHMPFGPVKSFTWGNGVTDTRTFDLDYRMTSVKDVGTGNIQYVSYGYDADDNLLTWTDNVTPANNQTLTYDVLSRINYASGPYGTVSSIIYDSNSNRTAYGATTYTYAASSNRLTNAGGSSVTATSAGNVKAIGADTFIYNKENQLSQATISGTATQFTYDAFWNRLRATTGGAQTQTLYAPDSSVLFQSTGGVQTNYAWLDGMPLAVIQPAAATMSMIHTDRLGTPQRATNAAKTIVWTGDYQPFGAVTPTTSITMNLRMPGQFVDATGFYHNGARDYVPNNANGSGRYLEVDPIGLNGGINPFIYALNNPFKFTDRFGLDTQYSFSFNGTAALFVAGVGGGVSVGVSVPDNVKDFGNYQFIASGQLNGMLGGGAFLGVGFSPAISRSNGPLRPGINGELGYYMEADIGIGPSLGFSFQGPLPGQVCTVSSPNGFNPPNAFSLGFPNGTPGAGYGVFIGGGLAVNGSYVSKPIGSFYKSP